MWTPAIVIAAVGTGCVGGVLYAFSSFVMPALSRVPAETAIRAMQSINVRAERPPLLLALAAPAVAAVALAIDAVRDPSPALPWVLAGTGLYLVVGLGVTGAVNVPLNNRLAASRTMDAATWASYARPWSRANHLRTVGSLLGAAAFTVAGLVR